MGDFATHLRAMIARSWATAPREAVVVLHPLTVEAMSRASAREQWYAQHRADRIARRDGVQPNQVARQFQGGQGAFMGVRIIEDAG